MVRYVRGAGYYLQSNTNGVQGGVQYGVKSFDSDGFTLGTSWGNISNNDKYVGWNWKAGTGAGSSNTDGSINTTSTSVNTTAGFSISKWTGTGSVATIGHGLGVVPNIVWVKSLSSTQNWLTGHHETGSPTTKQLFLNGTQKQEVMTNGRWNNTAPTSSVFTIGNKYRLMLVLKII